jgi:hypothetical protein
MKTHLIVSALALAATAVASNAGAEQSYGSGANFQPYNAFEATLIDYVPSGVRTVSANPLYVFASVDHHPAGSYQTVYIHGSHSGMQTTTCTLYAYSFAGVLRGSSTVSALNVSGDWERALTFASIDEVPVGVYLSVLCLIPANAQGVLHGVSFSAPYISSF